MYVRYNKGEMISLSVNGSVTSLRWVAHRGWGGGNESALGKDCFLEIQRRYISK